MSDKNKQFKVSLGLLVGYIIASLVHVIFFKKNAIEAFTDKKIIFLFAGAAFAYWLYNKEKNKKK